jgi:hypothetical protein
MQEQRINFETAKLAKEKGFHWRRIEPIVEIYPGGGPRMVFTDDPWEMTNGNACFNEAGKQIHPKMYNPQNAHYPRPTQALLNKWLRERCDLHVMCNPVGRNIKAATAGQWLATIVRLDNGEVYLTEPIYHESCEQAMEIGLFYALNLIKSIS